MSITQSPDADEMQVWTRVPGSCSAPVRRSRTWPSHQADHARLADTHPAAERHLHTGAFARIHQRRRRIGRDAAPLRANVTVPPAPAGAALDTANRSRCSRSPMPAADQTFSAWLSMPSGPQAQVWRSRQSGTSWLSRARSSRPSVRVSRTRNR